MWTGSAYRCLPNKTQVTFFMHGSYYSQAAIGPSDPVRPYFTWRIAGNWRIICLNLPGDQARLQTPSRYV